MQHLIIIEEKTDADPLDYPAVEHKLSSSQVTMHGEAQALVKAWNQKTGRPHTYEIIRDYR